MVFRVTNITISSDLADRIGRQRDRLSVLEERLASGKRINRPSDDPSGAEAVLNLRTSVTEIEQFGRNALAVFQKLAVTDETLNGYLDVLNRAKTLVTNGLSDTATQPAKDALAAELETLRARILDIANTRHESDYLFGGTRQSEPPYDRTTSAPATTPALLRHIQIEPGANAIPVGALAENIFADTDTDANIFTDLDSAISALRGTGDPAADRTALEDAFKRLEFYFDRATAAQGVIGANMNNAELAGERLAAASLAFRERISAIEDADFARTATEYTEAQNALDATLQLAARNQRSLIDFLG